MGIYKVGFCPLCGEQIQVQDCMGRWVGVKSNFRQADLIWPNGHRCRTIICKSCLPTADVKALFDIIVAPNSYASSREVLDGLAKLGDPEKLVELKRGE